MHIHDDMIGFIAHALDAIEQSNPPAIDQRCPHCNLVVRYPVIARKRDVERFAELMALAQRVLDRHGIAALVLSEVRTEIELSIIAKKQKPDGA